MSSIFKFPVLVSYSTKFYLLTFGPVLQKVYCESPVVSSKSSYCGAENVCSCPVLVWMTDCQHNVVFVNVGIVVHPGLHFIELSFRGNSSGHM